MPEAHDRVSAAVLLVLDLAGGPDVDRAQALLREVSAWRESVDPAWASTALIGEAWAWMSLSDTGRTLKIADRVSDPGQRDNTLAILVLRAGSNGSAEAALFLASEIKAADAKARALAVCAREAFVSGHRDAATKCLEAARGPVSELMDAVERGGLDPDLRADIDSALRAAATAELLAGNDAAAAEIIEAPGFSGHGIFDQIIPAYVDAGDYTMAILLVYEDPDGLRQAKALSYLARKLATQEFGGD